MRFPYRFIFMQIKLILLWQIFHEETEAQGNSEMNGLLWLNEAGGTLPSNHYT